MPIRILFILLSFLALPVDRSWAGPPDNADIRAGEVLDLERCVEIALRMQPSIRAAKGQAAASQSRIGQARSNYYPQVNLTAGYSRSQAVSAAIRSGDYFTNSLTISQNIYDFGRRSALVNAEEHTSESFSEELGDTISATVFNVKQAYYALLQAGRNREVAGETVRQFERQLEQAQGFFEAGLRPRFDVTSAEVDLSNARLNLIRAENNIRLLDARLRNEMGVPEAPAFDIKDDLDLTRVEMTLDDAIAKALQSRQDIRAAQARTRSSGEAVRLAESGNYPFITGIADYTWAGEGYPFDDGWTAGVTLTWPVFSGFFTRNQVSESKSSLEVSRSNEDTIRQAVLLEVQQAYYNLQESQERIPAAELALRQAKENLDIANGRYSTGVGSPIEVTDATLSYINAKTALVQALTDYKTAVAGLERAVGER